MSKHLGGPCIFCGYNGQNFYSAGTHDTDCPWYGVGGSDVGDVVFFKAVHDVFRNKRALADRIESLEAENAALREKVRNLEQQLCPHYPHNMGDWCKCGWSKNGFLPPPPEEQK